MGDVVVAIGPGQIGQAVARRVGVGKHVLLAAMLFTLRFGWRR